MQSEHLTRPAVTPEPGYFLAPSSGRRFNRTQVAKNRV